MSDLIARLRNPAWSAYPAHGAGFVSLATEQVVADMKEAADEIERLRAALVQIVESRKTEGYMTRQAVSLQNIAWAALGLSDQQLRNTS